MVCSRWGTRHRHRTFGKHQARHGMNEVTILCGSLGNVEMSCESSRLQQEIRPPLCAFVTRLSKTSASSGTEIEHVQFAAYGQQKMSLGTLRGRPTYSAPGLIPTTRPVLLQYPPGLRLSQVLKSSNFPLICGFGSIDFQVTDVPSAPLVGTLVSQNPTRHGEISSALYIPVDTPSKNDGYLQAGAKIYGAQTCTSTGGKWHRKFARRPPPSRVSSVRH